MAQEIERKFLVAGEFIELAHYSMRLIQGYIATGYSTVRVRISSKGAWLTIKGPSSKSGLSRYEWEHKITLNEALELLQLCVSDVIEKERYYVKYEGHTFEIDVFEGRNKGLTLAEVELKSVDEEFVRPPWLGAEVTGIPRYYNSNLHNYPYSEWSEEERTGKAWVERTGRE